MGSNMRLLTIRKHPDFSGVLMSRIKMLLFAAAAIYLMTLVAYCARATAETVPGSSLRVIDGDTVQTAGGETIRVYNIDAPETDRARCDAEYDLGVRAARRLRELLSARPVSIERCEPPGPLGGQGRCIDRYRRTLARLTVQGSDIGLQLVTEGLAVRWNTKKRADWCGGVRP
jgi:micrococcal nuclease